MIHRVVTVQIHAANELENFKHDCVLIFREGDCFIHALRIPRNGHEWEKYVPVHELDSGCKKSGRPCDSWTTGVYSEIVVQIYAIINPNNHSIPYTQKDLILLFVLN